METILINNFDSHLAKIGERYILTFSTTTIAFLENFQVDQIKRKIDADDRIMVESIDHRRGVLKIKIKIIKNPFPIAVAVTLGLTALVGLFAFTSLSKVEQILETPAVKLATIGTLIAVLIGGLTLVGLARR